MTVSAAEGGVSAMFIARLRRRLSADPGFAARLRRAAGSRLAERRALVEWYGFLNGVPAPLRDGAGAEVAYLVATLLAHDRRAYRPAKSSLTEPTAADSSIVGAADPGSSATGPPDNFGATLARLRNPGHTPEKDAMARRLTVLLDSTLGPEDGTLPWRLRRLVGLAVQRGARINWPRLLDDLLRWNRPERRVQRDWVRGYYRLAAAAQRDDVDNPSHPATPEEGAPHAD